MWLPRIRGIIDRRILVNYHVDPAVLAGLLPAPFRPKLVHGFGMVGICLIRLKHLRPIGIPSWLGITTENAAHRVAVEWDDGDERSEGVYVRRRDTNSRFIALAGGRIFPGYHSHARFRVNETQKHYQVVVQSDDGITDLTVRGHCADQLPPSSIFNSLNEASEFFQAGSVGYSATPNLARFQGLELRCQSWRVDPLEIEEVKSSYFDDASLFPKGSIEFDCALLMRGIEHEWYGKSDICCAQDATTPILSNS